MTHFPFGLAWRASSCYTIQTAFEAAVTCGGTHHCSVPPAPTRAAPFALDGDTAARLRGVSVDSPSAYPRGTPRRETCFFCVMPRHWRHHQGVVGARAARSRLFSQLAGPIGCVAVSVARQTTSAALTWTSSFEATETQTYLWLLRPRSSANLRPYRRAEAPVSRAAAVSKKLARTAPERESTPKA